MTDAVPDPVTDALADAVTDAVTNGAPEPAAPAADAVAPAAPPAADTTLDLLLAPEAAARFWRARALAPLRSGRTRRTSLRLSWHDAPTGELARGGTVLLRVEEPDRSAWHRQLLARDGAAIWPLGHPPPLLDAPVMEAAGPPPPFAVFEGHRRRLGLAPGGAVSEVALLEGTLTAGAVAPVAQLSLRGTPAAVLELARALLEELPLTVSEAGLAGLAWRAAGGGGSGPRPPLLREDLDVDDAFCHVVAQLAATIVHHAPAARAAHGMEPVHQMRVALRRLRSALSLFRKLAGGPELDRARRDLAGLARALGPARDWDVFLGGTGREVARLLPEEPAVKRLVAAAGRRRRLAYEELARVLDDKDFQRLLLGLIELALVRPWRGEAAAAGLAQDRPRLIAFARRALDRKLRQVSGAGEDLSPLAAAELHAVRIRCKRLRYAAELFVPLAPAKATRRFLRRLSAVQERLGELNDGAVAAGLLADLGSRGFAAGIVHGYLAARTAGARAKAERSWRKLRRADPFWQ